MNFTAFVRSRTLQEIFQVAGTSATGYLGAAANASDESDLFQSGVVPTVLPMRGDINRDGFVNVADISALMGRWPMSASIERTKD